MGPTQFAHAESQPDLIKETEEIDFTAEGRLLAASFYVGGLVKVPKEVKEVRSQCRYPLSCSTISIAANCRDCASQQR